MFVVNGLRDALLLALGMAWQVGWSLVLGFALSAAVQVLVSKEQMQRVLGRDGIREIALATGFGAASSSCSYAAASMSKTLFKKGAALVPSLAFLFSSTNLVIELGLILWLLLGWQFAAAEWLGGLVLIAITALLVKLTYPRALVEAARAHPDATSGHDHDDEAADGATLGERLRRRETYVRIAQAFTMEIGMLWGDLALGFLIAGALAAFVPGGAWHALFLTGAPEPWPALAGALSGPLIAVISFVCSIGNVPLAAVLWASGISFAGVLAFLYADLIVFPLLDIYRKYYGERMMLYITGIFFVAMAGAALVMNAAFSALHLVPIRTPNAAAAMTTFALNYTFWLNLVFGAVALALWRLAASQPVDSEHHCAHHGV